jgi:hypothetical protein
VSFLTPVWSYVDALVHPAAQQDALTLARHRAFIAPRLLGRLPFEGGSGAGTGDLIKFVPERGRGIAMTANIQMKKSA